VRQTPKWAQQALAIKIAYPRFVAAAADRLAPQINSWMPQGFSMDALDDCCHLNELGSKMLTMAVVDEIKRICARKIAVDGRALTSTL
jgi:hypothetical protein